MKSRAIVLSTFALTAVASLAQAQQTFSVGTLAVTNTTQGQLVGNASGVANTFLVTTSWSPAAGGPYSSEARFSLNSDPNGSGISYLPTRAFSVGTAGNENSTTIWSYGTLNSPVTSGASIALRYNQSFGGSSATWADTRVVLNPTINDTASRIGLAVPATFTDLGTLSVGSTNRSINAGNAASGAAGRNWYRFSVSSNVSSARGNALDIFGTNSGDSSIVIFRQTAAGLLPIAEGDDIAGSANRNAGVSFGSADPTSNGRSGYSVVGNPGYFQGQGGDRIALAGFENGFFSGENGGASLLAGETYFIGFSRYSPYITSSLAGGSATLGLDGISVNVSGTYSLAWGNPTSALGAGATLEVRSVPSPGATALVALGGLALSRRRRK